MANKKTKHEIHELEGELHDVGMEQQQTKEKTNKLQIIVYPAMVAFIILAAYGFYLIQSLTSDVHRMAETMIIMANSVDSNMTTMSKQMNSLVLNTNVMTGNMGSLANDTNKMSLNTTIMANNITEMQYSTNSMANSTYYMQKDIWGLNRSVSKPLNFMNSFIPWGNSNRQIYSPPAMMTKPYYSQQPITVPVIRQNNANTLPDSGQSSVSKMSDYSFARIDNKL